MTTIVKVVSNKTLGKQYTNVVTVYLSLTKEISEHFTYIAA